VARIKIGDVVEIITSRGLAYTQYTHSHPDYLSLMRVFATFYSTRPENFAEVVKQPLAFNCFLPLSVCVHRKIFAVVANVPISAELRDFPLFRTGFPDSVTRKIHNWTIWDGQSSTRVGALTADQRKLSLRGIWNDTLLIERLESGWRPETDTL